MSTSTFTPAVLTIPAAGGTGSGQGELNVVTNPSAVTDLSSWTAVGLLASRDSSGSPLDPVVPTGFSLSTSAIGQTFTSASLTVPSSLRNTKLKLEFYMNQATAAYKVDVLNSLGVRFPLSSDTSGASNLPALSSSGKYTTTFDMDGGSTIQIRFTSILTSGVLKFTQAVAGPGVIVQGAAVGFHERVTTYTIGATVTPPTPGSGATFLRETLRDGSDAIIRYEYNQSALGSNGSGDYLFPIPSGLTVDYTRVGATGAVTTTSDVGSGSALAASTVYQIKAYSLNSGLYANKIFCTLYNDTVSGSAWSGGVVGLGANATTRASFTVRIPIAEWAGSGTVNLGAGAQVEYASNGSTSTTANDTTSFGYGPQGALIQNITTSLSRRVRLQYPIQSDDIVQVEISEDRLRWYPLTSIFTGVAGASLSSWQLQGATSFGLGRIQPVSGSSTDLDIFFGTYALQTNTTYNTPGTAWSSGAGSYYWRVRKAKAGAAVGFGMAGTDGSAGLYKAGQAPGQTTGVAIAAGYIGQTVVYTASAAGTTTSSSYATLTTDHNLSIPSAGVWMVFASGGVYINTTSGADISGSVQLFNSTTATVLGECQDCVGININGQFQNSAFATHSSLITIGAETVRIRAKVTGGGTSTVGVRNGTKITAVRIA